MSGDVDFTRGGYGGDHFEESFKYFTAQHMEYWWQFREVLIASDRKKNVHCTYKNGDPLSDDDLREFIALSLTNYAVYVSITETLIFWNETRNYISGGHFLKLVVLGKQRIQVYTVVLSQSAIFHIPSQQNSSF